MNLFIKEDFSSHAGLPLTWKVECDALTEKDYEALAKIVSEKITFCDVKGIPRGGIPFEKALKKNNTVENVSPSDFTNICNKFNNQCAYCGKIFTHIKK